LPAKYRRCIGARPRSRHIRELFMSVDLSAVRRIAHLARIEVTEAETPHLQDEINAILKFVEALDAVNVDGVEPMTSVIPMRLPMREDVVTDGGIAPLVLANAPMTEDGFFVVPKVIE
jgi:aspartyl-tRNA(Asn)/glutamyl-tRNA(Gln) amidotransferase subunit C